MNMVATVSIPLDQIEIGERLRQVDADWIDGLAQSIEFNGLQSPIIVGTPAKKKGAKHPLIAGAHRLNAVRQLGWTEIPAIVFDGDALQARLLEIDENLIRRELSPLDRASHLAERKELYEQLYPETQAGAAGAAARWGHASDKLSFASEAAIKLGLSERDIQRAISRYRRIAPDVRTQIATTWLAGKGSELDALATLEHDEQRKVVAALLDAENGFKSVKEAALALRGVRRSLDGSEAQFEALMRSWRKADGRARKRFLAHLVETGDLDAPIERAA